MTWLGWLSQLVGMCPHAHSYKERDLQDRLGLRCEACHRWVPVIALAWGLFCWALFLGWIGGGLQ